MKRIGLTQRVEEIKAYGEFRDMLDQNWFRFLRDLGLLPVPIPTLVADVVAYAEGLKLEGLVLTGGNDIGERPDRDQLEATLIDYAAQTQRPLLGVCRGLQMLVTHYGGKLSKVEGHVAQRHPVMKVGQEFTFWPPNFEVNSYHQFGIAASEVKTPLAVLTQDAQGHVEALRHQSLPQFGIMWHPERERPFRELEKDLFRKVFGL